MEGRVVLVLSKGGVHGMDIVCLTHLQYVHLLDMYGVHTRPYGKLDLWLPNRKESYFLGKISKLVPSSSDSPSVAAN